MVPDDGRTNPAPWDQPDINNDEDTTDLVPNYGAFTDVGESLRLTQAMDRRVDVSISGLPEFGEGAVGVGAVLLPGYEIPGRGMIPVGISLMTDQDEDGVTDGTIESANIPMASQHSGGGQFQHLIIAAAMDIQGMIERPGLIERSFLIQRLGMAMPESVDIGEFPAFPTYDVDLEARSLIVNAPAKTDLVRLAFPRWHVFMRPGTEAILPRPWDYGFEWRLPGEDLGGKLNVNTIELIDGLDYATLLAFNTTNLDRLNDLLHGFTSVMPPATKGDFGCGGFNIIGDYEYDCGVPEPLMLPLLLYALQVRRLRRRRVRADEAVEKRRL
jgi:hypothetical protein